MKAIVQSAYGSPAGVLSLRDVAKPTPAPDEVLVRMHAAGVHPDVWHLIAGWPYVLRVMGAGFRRPKSPVPGIDVAGVVDTVGAHVTRFKPGDAVFGATVFMRWANGGTYAEYVAVPERLLVAKPPNVTFEQAASVVSPGLIALMNFHPERIQPSWRVAVNGAAGNVGSLFAQIARSRGARVTGVDAIDKLSAMRDLGIEETVDYKKEDFTQRGERYDLIFDVPTTLSRDQWERALEPAGIYWIIGHDHFGTATGAVLGSIPRMIPFMIRAARRGQLGKGVLKFATPLDALQELRRHLEARTLTPHVTHTFALAEAASALQCMIEGKAAGRIVIHAPHT